MQRILMHLCAIAKCWEVSGVYCLSLALVSEVNPCRPLHASSLSYALRLLWPRSILKPTFVRSSNPQVL